MIDGTSPSGLQDIVGRYLDGADTGQAGSNAVISISKNGVNINDVGARAQRQDRVDHVPVDVGQAAVDAIVAESERGVVDAHQVEDRRVQVVAIGLASGGPPGPGVALAVGRARLDARAGEPGDRCPAVMIAAGGCLA